MTLATALSCQFYNGALKLQLTGLRLLSRETKNRKISLYHGNGADIESSPRTPANHVEGLIPGCTVSNLSMPATSGPLVNCGPIVRASLNPDGASLCNPISRLNPDDARLYRTPNVAQYLTLLDTCSKKVLLKRQRRPRNWIVTLIYWYARCGGTYLYSKLYVQSPQSELIRTFKSTRMFRLGITPDNNRTANSMST